MGRRVCLSQEQALAQGCGGAGDFKKCCVAWVLEREGRMLETCLREAQATVCEPVSLALLLTPMQEIKSCKLSDESGMQGALPIIMD